MQPELTRDEASEILLRHGIPHMAVFGSADLVNLCGTVVARRLAALESVVEAARKVSDASLSMAAATSGGAAKVNVQDVAEAAAAMDEGWLALDTALAALDGKGASDA